MKYAHARPPRDAEPAQFFALPHNAVADPSLQEDMWLFWGDELVDVEHGTFTVEPNGRLVFVPNSD